MAGIGSRMGIASPGCAMVPDAESGGGSPVALATTDLAFGTLNALSPDATGLPSRFNRMANAPPAACAAENAGEACAAVLGGSLAAGATTGALVMRCPFRIGVTC